MNSYLVLSGDLLEENYTDVYKVEGWSEESWQSIKDKFPTIPDDLPEGTIHFYEEKMLKVGNKTGPSDFFRFRGMVFMSERLVSELLTLVPNLKTKSLKAKYGPEQIVNDYFAVFIETVADAIDWASSEYVVKYGCRVLQKLRLDPANIPNSIAPIFWVKDDTHSVLVVKDPIIGKLTDLRDKGFRGFNVWKSDIRLFSYYLG